MPEYEAQHAGASIALLQKARTPACRPADRVISTAASIPAEIGFP